MDRAPAFHDRLVGAFEGLFQLLFRLSRRQQLVHHLKAQHQSLETLQERVVQIAGEARALADTFVQPHVEFPRDLIEADSIEAPEQSQKRRRRIMPGTKVSDSTPAQWKKRKMRRARRATVPHRNSRRR